MSALGSFKRRIKREALKAASKLPMFTTYWNGEPHPAQRVMVTIGTVPSGWWCDGMQGHTRKAVEVYTPDNTVRFYLDDEDGDGWAKVTVGRGGPAYRHSSLPDDSQVVAYGVECFKCHEVLYLPLSAPCVGKSHLPLCEKCEGQTMKALV